MLTIRLRLSGPAGPETGDFRSVRTVEAGAPLSGSLLWRLVCSDATGVVPGAGTRAAQAILRWARSRKLDPDHPVDVLELSAGAGEYGRELCQTLFAPEQTVRFRVLLTDPDKRAAELLARDKVLRPLIRSGQVDVACFDPVLEPLVAPLTKGDNLVPGYSPNPLVVCSHGDLGRRPADLLRFDMGRMQEALVMLTGPMSIPDPPRARHLPRLVLEWRWRDTDSVYYRDDRVRAVVEDIADELDEGAVPIPVGAVHALDRLRTLADGRLFLIAEEGGSDDLAALQVPDAPSDGITLPTNLYVLSAVARASGGTVFTAAYGPQDSVFLCEFGADGADLPSLAVSWSGHDAVSDGAAGLAMRLEASQFDPFLLLDLDVTTVPSGSVADRARLSSAVERTLTRLAALQAATDLPDTLRAWLLAAERPCD